MSHTIKFKFKEMKTSTRGNLGVPVLTICPHCSLYTEQVGGQRHNARK